MTGKLKLLPPNWPTQVTILNKRIKIDLSAATNSPPQFQLHPTSQLILLDNVSFGPDVVIAAGVNARISLENCALHNCTIAAPTASSIYLRRVILNEAHIRARQDSRMLLEYLQLTDNTHITECPHIVGIRHGSNRVLKIAYSSLSGKLTLKGNGSMRGAHITISHPHALTLHHGYTTRVIDEITPPNTPQKSLLTDIALCVPAIDP